jgi:hypothetical protein
MAALIEQLHPGAVPRHPHTDPTETEEDR